MIKPTDICPVLFPKECSVGLQRDYIQKFATGDIVRVQMKGQGSAIVSVSLCDVLMGAVVESVQAVESICFFESQYDAKFMPSDGMYMLKVEVGDMAISSGMIEVTDSDVELENLIIVDYGTGVDNMFRFRVEGGFLADSDTPGLENEFFRNQLQQPEQLYQCPYVKSRLTIGNATGVPQWVGTLLNNILCCDKVSIDGLEYVRSESSVPERVKIGPERYPLFQFNVEVERDVITVGIEIPTIPMLRMVGDGIFRIIPSNLWRRV